MRWLLGLIFVLLASVAQAACPLTGPQTVNSPYVVSGADQNCNFTFRQLGTNELTSPYPFSTTSSSATLGYGQMTLALDNWNGFATGMVVQVTYQADPTQYIIGAITSFSASTGTVTVNALVPNPSNIVAAGFNVQVLGGSPINGVPVWAGLSIDGTDSITNPSAQGSVVTLNIETGKAFTNFSTVYVWAPQDITTWFVGVVLSYNTSSGQMKVFVTQTPNTGNSYSTNYVSLIDTQGPAPALSGYSSTSQTLGSGSFTFTTQSGQFFPIDGQVLASCIDQANPNAYMAGQVTAYSGTSLIINVSGSNGVFGSGTCGAWSLYLTTGPTTRISLYQMNGLQMSGSGSTLTVNAGSVRDSTDTIDLVLSSKTTLSFAAGSTNVIGVQGPGTISITVTSVTGTGTAFQTTFSTAGTLTDLNNQLSALNLSTMTFPTVLTDTTNPLSASTTVVSSNTAASLNDTGTGAAGDTYYRGGIQSFNHPLSTTVAYGIYLAYQASTGAIGLFATSFTPSGNPDLPSGYSYYRIIGYVILGGANTFVAIGQPLANNVLTTVGDISYYGQATGPFSFTYPTFLQRLGIGSTNNVLGVSSGLPAWLTASTVFAAGSPLTTEGDLLYYHSSANARLAVGSNTFVLASDGTDPLWEAFSSACTAATSSTFGCVKVDNSTITASSGVITTANTTVAGATCTPGSSCGLSKAQNTLSGDVSLSNTANYFDGPSMAQGTSGTWWASGTVTLQGTLGDAVDCKLWDGTTVMSSFRFVMPASTSSVPASLSGYLASPAANIRISCKDGTHTTGVIKFNSSGNSADSTIWGIRINFLEHPIPANDNDLIEKLVA